VQHWLVTLAVPLPDPALQEIETHARSSSLSRPSAPRYDNQDSGLPEFLSPPIAEPPGSPEQFDLSPAEDAQGWRPKLFQASFAPQLNDRNHPLRSCHHNERPSEHSPHTLWNAERTDRVTQKSRRPNMAFRPRAPRTKHGQPTPADDEKEEA
jgi:hypothetical protein